MLQNQKDQNKYNYNSLLKKGEQKLTFASFFKKIFSKGSYFFLYGNYIYIMSNRSDVAKVKSTDRAGIQSKSKSRDISGGNLMDGDVRSEYEYLRLHQLKAEIRDKAADSAGENKDLATKALANNFKKESESERVASTMLKYLNGLSDYSAEFAQISSVAGMTSRVDIARDLAKRYCDSHSTQIVLDKMLGGSPNTVIARAFRDTKEGNEVNGITAGNPDASGGGAGASASATGKPASDAG